MVDTLVGKDKKGEKVIIRRFRVNPLKRLVSKRRLR